MLAGVALGGAVILGGRLRVETPPLPAPPIIAAARDALPAGIVAFEERVKWGDRYGLAGSGFFLGLANGDVIGVTTAHSLEGIGFTHIVFARAGDEQEPVAAFSELYAPLGRPPTADNVTVDCTLLKPESPPHPALVLQADPRGAPQLGERVLLFSGLGDGRGRQRTLPGTVESADGNAVWLRMDEVFDPTFMSGSPVLSQHTGRVVGVTILASLVSGTLRIGINPIAAILAHAAH